MRPRTRRRLRPGGCTLSEQPLSHPSALPTIAQDPERRAIVERTGSLADAPWADLPMGRLPAQMACKRAHPFRDRATHHRLAGGAGRRVAREPVRCVPPGARGRAVRAPCSYESGACTRPAPRSTSSTSWANTSDRTPFIIASTTIRLVTSVPGRWLRRHSHQRAATPAA